DLRGATDALVGAVDAGNRYVEVRRPWTLPDRAAVLGDLAGLCRALAAEPAPFLPDGAARLTARLDGTSTDPAFPRLRPY
ncbi:MAG: methionine--tRNA ligase, partial [Pseudonocardia sp.]|nr:methionine--tRNA ligase [Pseudonocardia sp.]